MTTLLAAFVLGAVVPLGKVDLDLHLRHPGAVGSLEQTGSGWTIFYDFAKGGHGVGLSVSPAAPLHACSFSFDACADEHVTMAFLVCDSTGQWFRKVAPSHPHEWRHYVCDLRSGWIGCWGGAKDGILHLPVTRFEVGLDRLHKGAGNPREKGSVSIENLEYGRASPGECAYGRVSSGVVTSLVTDFRTTNVFNGGERKFFRTDRHEAWGGGRIDLDFSSLRAVQLKHDLPVWGDPREFKLTVEAPADAAGIEFSIVYRTVGTTKSLSFGRLRNAAPGERLIRQTLSASLMSAQDSNADFDPLKRRRSVRSKRVTAVVIGRGCLMTERTHVNLVKLDVVMAAGSVRMPIIADFQQRGRPPSTMQVGLLNLESATRENVRVDVVARDWENQELGRTSSVFATVSPGSMAFTRVALPKIDDGLNFVAYECHPSDGNVRDFDNCGCTVCWTRPVRETRSLPTDASSPWGMCVCLGRTADFQTFGSAYETVTNAANIKFAEVRAALAACAGIRWERLEFKPSLINRRRGDFDFSTYDRLLDIAESKGLACLGFCSHYFPLHVKPYSEDAYAAYVETVRRLAERYRGRITSWEVWNEPNLHYWEGPKEDYPRLVTRVHDVLKAVDPSNSVVACVTSRIPLDYIDMCCTNNMCYDSISVHPYRAEPCEEAFLEDIRAVYKRSRGQGIWLTEMGWPTGCDDASYSEIEQAAYYARAYLTAAGSGKVNGIFGYDLVDDGFNVAERENNFGIVRRDLSPKPAYRAITKVCRAFASGRATLVSQDAAKGGRIWIFRMGDRTAIWSKWNTSVSVRTATACRAENLMNEPISEVGVEHRVSIGPLRIVFFNSELRGFSEYCQMRKGSVVCPRLDF